MEKTTVYHLLLHSRYYIIPTAEEILFSRTFPGQTIQELKVINQNVCEKAYHIYSMYDQLLTYFMVHPPPHPF